METELELFADWITNNWFIPVGYDSEWTQDVNNIEYSLTIPDLPNTTFTSEELVKMYLDKKGEF